MGDWRVVNIVGNIAPQDLGSARAFVDLREGTLAHATIDWPRFHCLAYVGHSLAGLGLWPDLEMDVVGNLAERNCTPQDVHSTLATMATVVPSMDIQCHVGGENESPECVATVVVRDGTSVLMPAQIETLNVLGMADVLANFMRAMRGE